MLIPGNGRIVLAMRPFAIGAASFRMGSKSPSDHFTQTIDGHLGTKVGKVLYAA